jgi:preprotein translocase subunit SecB
MTNTDGQAAAQPTPGAQPNLGLVAQYVKDLSFENPGAPASLRTRSANQPNINITIGVNTLPMQNNEFETELRIDARAADGQTVLFALELVYAGTFRYANISAENLKPLAMIECPRLLFPFARQIVAEVSRNGGFPPLLIDPVDFATMYRQNQQQTGTTTQPAPAN